MGWALATPFASSAATGITAAFLTEVPLLLLILLHSPSPSITGAGVETPPGSPGGLRETLLGWLVATS